MLENKATLVIIKNPFQPWNGRIVKQISAGQKLSHAIFNCGIVGCEIRTVVDGKLIDNDYEIVGGEIITLSPVVGKGGGKILGIVAAVALSVVSMGVGSIAAGGSFAIGSGSALATATGWSAVAGYMAAAAVMFIGSSLIGRYMGQQSLGKYDSYENDPTYSWNGTQTMDGQGNAIALTYGKVKSGGQSIGRYVSTVDNKETLNWLVACGEGELEITNIKVNDNEISYYKDVTCEIRNGTNDQEIISNFNDTYFTKNLGYQLLDDYATDVCQGDATEGIIIKLECANGLYYANDSGGLSTAWIDLTADYRKQGESAWSPFWLKRAITNKVNNVDITNKDTPLGTFKVSIVETREYDRYDEYYKYYRTVTIITPSGNSESERQEKTYEYDDYNEDGSYVYKTLSISGLNIGNISSGNFDVVVGDVADTVRISDAKSSAVRKEYRKDNLPAGTYEVRVKVMARSHAVTNSRAATRIWWNSLTSIVYDDFCYPNITLIGVKALATDQLSGSPSLTFIKERKYVWVYNPYNEAYEQKPANNPAWASYDMVHQCQRLKNIHTGEYEYEISGAPAKTMIYDQFNEWAKFCEDKKLFINIEITQCGEMLDIINSKVANVGRGMVVRFGTKYGCVWNCAKPPVQMFGMGNIIAGTFKEDFLQVSDRANCVEITFTNAEHDYERETVVIYNNEYDNDAEAKTAQATFDGITSYEQAYREGMYQLYANKYQLRTVSFEANIDAIACTIGDVVLVSHDVPKWAFSGRIFNVDIENNTLTLPIAITDMDKKYRVMYRTVKDVLHTSEVEIVGSIDDLTVVKCNDKFDVNDLPNKNDIFDVALINVGSKPFIVKSITRAQDFTRVLTLLEYSEALYNEDYDIPVIDYSDQTNNKAPNVTSLQARCNQYLTEGGEYMYHLDVSWDCSKPCRYTVYSSNSGTDWNIIENDLSAMEYSVDTKTPPRYIKVTSMYNNVISSGTVATVENINYVKLPKVRNLKVYADYIDLDDGVTCDVYISWDKPLLFNEYVTAQIYYKYRDTWEFLGQGYTSYTYADVPLGRTYTIAVCVVDTKGKTQNPDEAQQATITIKNSIVEETPETPEERDEENA